VGLESAIYEGSVRHRRYGKVQREFSYRIFMVYLDLEEVGSAMSKHALWSTRPRSPVRFRRADYLGPAALPLDVCVRDTVENRTGKRPAGPVRMLTNLRYFGIVENPVTFYYCFGPDGSSLEAVVAEVTNTPWGDRHAYVIDGRLAGGARVCSRLDKVLHVSPLMDMEHTYELSFGRPGQTIPVHITSEKDGVTAFDATLNLSRTEMTSRSMSRILLTYPPMSMRVLSGIYRQAALTWLAGAKFHARPRGGHLPAAGPRDGEALVA
jgi:DUF1365 family protein